MGYKFLRIDESNNRMALTPGTVFDSGPSNAGKPVLLDTNGKINADLFPGEVSQGTFVTTEVINGSGYALNIYDVTGTAKVRLADGTLGRPCHCFSRAAAGVDEAVGVDFDYTVTLPATVSPGYTYYLGNSGQVTTAPDVNASGAVIQSVGTAVSTTELEIELGELMWND